MTTLSEAERKARHCAASRAWYAAHLEQARARNREWARAHPEQARARHRKSVVKWKLAHPEQVRMYDQRYRARKAGVASTLTVSEWQAICAAYKFKCAYCGRKLTLTQDHVQPLSKGGGTVAANTVPACGACNSGKQDGPPPKPVNLALGI